MQTAVGLSSPCDAGRRNKNACVPRDGHCRWGLGLIAPRNVAPLARLTGRAPLRSGYTRQTQRVPRFCLPPGGKLYTTCGAWSGRLREHTQTGVALFAVPYRGCYAGQLFAGFEAQHARTNTMPTPGNHVLSLAAVCFSLKLPLCLCRPVLLFHMISAFSGFRVIGSPYISTQIHTAVCVVIKALESIRYMAEPGAKSRSIRRTVVRQILTARLDSLNFSSIRSD